MTPQTTKTLIEDAWTSRGLAFSNNRAAWAIYAMRLVPRRGTQFPSCRTPRRYLPLYRQPRLGLPKRPRKRSANRAH